MNIVITGGSNGLGARIVDELLFSFFNIDVQIYNLDSSVDNKSQGEKRYTSGILHNINCDVTQYLGLQEAAQFIGDSCDILINCAGLNSINYLENVTPETFDQVMNTNARAIFYTVKEFLPSLTKNKGTILNIVSNASHMPMTNSLAYNASKGAAHIMTLQLARELTKKNGITVFGISPNKLAGTKMSEYIDRKVPELRGFTSEAAKQYQLNSLVTGEETDPKQLAEFIGFLLSTKRRHKYLSGCIIPYGA